MLVPMVQEAIVDATRASNDTTAAARHTRDAVGAAAIAGGVTVKAPPAPQGGSGGVGPPTGAALAEARRGEVEPPPKLPSAPNVKAPPEMYNRTVGVVADVESVPGGRTICCCLCVHPNQDASTCSRPGC